MLQVLKVLLNSGNVTSPVKGSEVGPAHRIVLSERVPWLAILGLEVRRSRAFFNPEELSPFQLGYQAVAR